QRAPSRHGARASRRLILEALSGLPPKVTGRDRKRPGRATPVAVAISVSGLGGSLAPCYLPDEQDCAQVRDHLRYGIVGLLVVLHERSAQHIDQGSGHDTAQLLYIVFEGVVSDRGRDAIGEFLDVLCAIISLGLHISPPSAADLPSKVAGGKPAAPMGQTGRMRGIL